MDGLYFEAFAQSGERRQAPRVATRRGLAVLAALGGGLTVRLSEAKRKKLMARCFSDNDCVGLDQPYCVTQIEDRATGQTQQPCPSPGGWCHSFSTCGA